MFNAENVKNQCVEWIRNFFEENGKGCNAVVGISGGKDSSIAAALCVEALGKDRVIGVYCTSETNIWIIAESEDGNEYTVLTVLLPDEY